MNKLQKIIIPTLIIILSISTIVYAENWQNVTTITGASSQTTNYFHISSGEWQIKWEITPAENAENYATIGIYAYPKGESNLYVTSILKFAGTTDNSGVNYVHEGNNDFYLVITSANIQSYKITIEQDTDATGFGDTNGSDPLDFWMGWIFVIAFGGFMAVVLPLAYIKGKRKREANKIIRN
jgi:hypothetical protein